MASKQTVKSPLVIIGFGNQAKAWALNLRDSGRKVYVALRENSPSRMKVQNLGFTLLTFPSHDLKNHSHFALLTPDHVHSQILKEGLPFFSPQATLIYAHGLSLQKEKLHIEYPSLNHLLLTPKSIASELRFFYETQGKVGGFYSVEFSTQPEKDKSFLMDLACDLGINVGPFPTSFKNETFADLFSEQSLLCSLLPYVGLACYNLLVQRGIEKELAFFECWHELKLIANTMVKMGPEKFFHLISPTALLGSEHGRKVLLGQDFHHKLTHLLDDIFQEKFFRQMDESDYEKVKEEVLAFWKKEDFLTTFQRLSPQLYP